MNLLPSNFGASTTEVMASFLTGMSGYTMLVLGVLLGTTVIVLIIRSLHK